jgi:hypothetical protein
MQKSEMWVVDWPQRARDISNNGAPLRATDLSNGTYLMSLLALEVLVQFGLRDRSIRTNELVGMEVAPDEKTFYLQYSFLGVTGA